MSDSSSAGEIPYLAIFNAILQRYVRLIGAPTAVNLARKVPGLVVDDQGRVTAFDQEDPLNILALLTEQFTAKFGEAAIALSRQAAEAVSPDHAPHLLPPLHRPKKGQIRLMLVDDHELFRQGLAGLLAAQPDMRVVGEASTVREAVAAVQSAQPDIVIMDITLPDGTGIEATRLVLAERPLTKVLCLTVHDDDERLFAALRAGAVGYLYKNARANDLLEQVRGVARGEAGLTRAQARRILDEFSRTPAPRPASPALSTELTPREVEIVRELAHGASNRQIAERFVISEYTVKNHVRNVLAKLRLRSRHEVAGYARDHGFVAGRPLGKDGQRSEG